MKKIKKVDGIGQKELSSAVEEFIRHCRLKNLSPKTIEYYSEDLKYFQKVSPIRYVDEFTTLVMEDFVDHEMTKGNSISAINTRIRGLRVFLNFCADREYIKKITFPLIKEDEHLKEPYTDAELQRLLKKPTSERWGEWRAWAAINTFLATGVRANTLVNIKICEVDFEHDTIFLRKLKNRKQQMIPLSKTLKEVLVLYLKLRDWDSEFFLFPSINNKQLSVHALEDSTRHYNISRNVTKTSLHLFRLTFSFEAINNTATFDLSDFRGAYCVGGVDLSITTDLTCASLLFMKRGQDTKYIAQMYWLPADRLQERVKQDKIPYDKWLARGLLRLCAGNTINYSDVTAWFMETVKEYELFPAWVYYDSYSARYFVEEMQMQGFNMVRCIQGAKTLSLPMQMLGADLQAHRVNYNNNPVLKWCLTNTGIQTDRNGNIVSVKNQSPRQRIDGTAALLDCYVGLYEHYNEFTGAI